MAELSYCADLIHRYDRDRYMATLVAAADRREALFSLLAFDHQTAAVAGLVRDPILGQIRLQWWLDSLYRIFAGTQCHHPVLSPLGVAIGDYELPRQPFLDILEARSLGLPPQSLSDPDLMEAAAMATGGMLNELMAVVLGLARLPDDRRVEAGKAARHAGAAWALSGVLLTGSFAGGATADALTAMAHGHIDAARRLAAAVPKSMLSVMLSTFLAEQRLRRWRKNPSRRGVRPGASPGAGHLFRFYLKVLSRSF